MHNRHRQHNNAAGKFRVRVKISCICITNRSTKAKIHFTKCIRYALKCDDIIEIQVAFGIVFIELVFFFVSLGNVAIETEFLGSVIRDGQLAWFAVGSSFEVFSVKTGQRVAGHLFDSKCVVTCVAEIPTNDIHSCLLLIAVQRAPVGGVLYLFSVQGSRIVHRIDVIDKITSCCFISDAACKRSNIRAFNGCAAVGTDAGEVFLIDLNLNRCKESK